MVPDLRVLDLSQSIAGAYCTKLLADAWADVVKIETAEGDPLRRWSASGARPEGEDGALFRYLCASKRSVAGDSAGGVARGVAGGVAGGVGGDVAGAIALAGKADLLVEDRGPGAVDVEACRRANPALVVVSISPYGLEGPWAGRPATEFTLQAACGSTYARGTEDRPPVYAGGRIGEWAAGVFAAIAGLAAWRSARRTGRGEHVDVSIFECMCSVFHPYNYLAERLGPPRAAGPSRTVEIPSIEPTADGYVGFCTITGQQFQDFLVLIERPDLLADEGLALAGPRYARRDEFLSIVHEWTTKRTTAEIIEQASAMRIPVVPVGDGATVATFDHFTERGIYVTNPAGFLQPRVPYSLGKAAPRDFQPAPALTERLGTPEWGSRRPRVVPDANGDSGPLAGVRVLDLTAFWAGPAATTVMGALGADVIKLESVQRPDGMRFGAASTALDRWWERGPVFQVVNPGKRSVTIDLTRPEGRALVTQLIANVDVVIENFTPRVMEQFHLTWDDVHAINPRAVLVRMPAFGLSGPWRDRAGFAQSMEQVSGMATITGYADGPPWIPRGPCDPISGMHAVVAVLCALEERERSGEGMLVEVPMVEGVLNVAAESEVEYSAYGVVLHRDGNRGPVAAPQGLYRAAGADERYVAVAVASDAQWLALRRALGDPEWAQSPDLLTAAGRRAAHDGLDAELGRWCAELEANDAADLLTGAGVAAEVVVRQPELLTNPQLAARRFYEDLEHDVIGSHPFPSLPFRFASKEGGWLRSPAPTLGQHNDEILGTELGLSPEDIDKLRADTIIGDRPVGA